MKSVLLKSVVAASLALGVAIYIIDSNKYDNLNQTAQQPTAPDASAVSSLPTRDTSAAPTAAAPQWIDSNAPTHYANVSDASQSAAHSSVSSQYRDMSPAEKAAMEQQNLNLSSKLGTENRNKVESGAAAVKAYHEAEGKR